MRSLDDLLATSKWAAALSTEHLQRVRSAMIVRELQPGNYACRKGDPSNIWVGVIDGLFKAESLSDTGKPGDLRGTPCQFLVRRRLDTQRGGAQI